jgi:hypothetical protein
MSKEIVVVIIAAITQEEFKTNPLMVEQDWFELYSSKLS